MSDKRGSEQDEGPLQQTLTVLPLTPTSVVLRHSKKLYAWETGPIDDRALVLLCGEIDFRVSHRERPLLHPLDALTLTPLVRIHIHLFPFSQLSASSLQLDRKLKLLVPPKTLVALKHLRAQLNAVVATRMRGKEVTEVQAEWWRLAMEMLGREKMVDEE